MQASSFAPADEYLEELGYNEDEDQIGKSSVIIMGTLETGCWRSGMFGEVPRRTLARQMSFNYPCGPIWIIVTACTRQPDALSGLLRLEA